LVIARPVTPTDGLNPLAHDKHITTRTQEVFQTEFF